MLNKRNVKINKCLNVLIRKIRITQVSLVSIHDLGYEFSFQLI